MQGLHFEGTKHRFAGMDCGGSGVTYEGEGERLEGVMDTDHISGLGNWVDDCIEVENEGGVDIEVCEIDSSLPIIL